MKIEIWSDFACPFCYIGETAMMKALEAMGLAESTVVEFKSFQLDVNAKRVPGKDLNEMLAEKYNISYEQAKTSNANIIKMAAEVGLHYDFDHIKPNHTGMAHEMHKFAEANGKGMEAAQLLFKAYLEDGVDIGEMISLLQIAEQIDLPPEALKEALDEKRYLEAVVTDQAIAHQQRIQSVPYFVIDRQYAISGAQSIDYFKMALRQILNETQGRESELPITGQ
ncbi:DsbA family oxidoreductase [Fusibacter paucivorans]|uniref:DsbA family oxidoreductase n=1 Tax=Fusibacter paucivorans TaxID=76009 RepID=A0ABS5PRM4_9FIRM|nr:DsbA family oxidoreductase [Fusibacter paucivorans]MBS7527815.1 DsbA family oxidoreductase [Fusibacter paucivorans]